MRHWNQLQPGGQGLTADFNAYYKALSDAEKEVCEPRFETIPSDVSSTRTKPFKQEMYKRRDATVSFREQCDTLMNEGFVSEQDKGSDEQRMHVNRNRPTDGPPSSSLGLLNTQHFVNHVLSASSGLLTLIESSSFFSSVTLSLSAWSCSLHCHHASSERGRALSQRFRNR